MQRLAGYTGVIEELVRRIEALVPAHPEILTMDNPFDLFRVEGFKCDDLAPSLAQAGGALAAVKGAHRDKPAAGESE